MQHNPWKFATIGLALMGTTALGTGLTTAYMLRPPATVSAQEVSVAPRAVVTTTPVPRVVPAVAGAPAPRAVPVSTAATDCATGGQRAMKIAKPGLLGGLLGAALGAGGGAIADGGKGAGKGALIGGIPGAAVGGGYGAYKTKNECGTIFGNAFGGGSSASPTYQSPTYQTAAQSALPSAGRGITVYNAK